MVKNKNNTSYSSVVNTTEESIYNSAKDWTEFLISEIKKTKKLRVVCLYGAETPEEIKKLSKLEITNNRVTSLRLYIYQIEEVINIGKEGIHENHEEVYEEIIDYIITIKEFLPKAFCGSNNNYSIRENYFSLILKESEGAFNDAIHLINKSGLIYKFIKKRDFKKEAFKKEQKFLTV